MKYMTKQFGTDDVAWPEEKSCLTRLVWMTATRMWGASKELTAVMRRPLKESDVTWDSIELIVPGEEIDVWSRGEGTPFPNFADETDPDDFCPEDTITKQLWRNHYSTLERWRKEKYL